MEWVKKHKSILSDITLFVIFYFVSFVVSFMIANVWCDQIWSYGFSYNISKGLIIYKDFNVLQMPLYFMIASIFIKIFGNYMICIYIFDSFLLAIISLFIYKSIGWKMIFPFLAFLILCPSSYNLLCMVFLFIILHLINKDDYKSNEYLVALLTGLIFIAKQNIGVLMFIPMFIFGKHKIKSIAIFLIPFLLLCIYFLFNNALFEFFDYVFFGLFEFGGNNKDIDITLLVVEIMCIGYLLYSFIKSGYKDKEAFYILIFQLSLYPLCEIRHYSLTFIPFLYYFLKTCKNNKIVIFACVFEVAYLSLAFYYNYLPLDIQTKKDLLYLRSPSKLSSYVQRINKRFDGNINNLYFDSDYSFLYKLYYNVNPTRLDFIMDGNMGYYSKKDIFKELDKHCKEEECIFVIYKKVGKDNQFSEYRNFIKKHYKKIDEFDGLDVYSSK